MVTARAGRQFLGSANGQTSFTHYSMLRPKACAGSPPISPGPITNLLCLWQEKSTMCESQGSILETPVQTSALQIRCGRVGHPPQL